MSRASSLDRLRVPGRAETIGRVILVGGALVLGGPFFVWGVLRLGRALQDRALLPWLPPALLMGLLSIAALIALRGAWETVDWYDGAILWLVSVPLVPAGALAMVGSGRIGRWLRPPTLVDRWRAQTATDEARAADSEARLGTDGELPPAPRGTVRLGRLIGSSSFRPDAGVWRSGPWIGLEESVLDHHMLVVGTTGSGKTETLKRVIGEVLENLPERDLFVVDGRGEPRFEGAVRDLVWHHRRELPQVCRLGVGRPGERYDAFRGDADAIYNRLLALVEVEQLEGNAIYYGRMIRDLFGLACKAPGVGPPRSFEQLRERLSERWLRDAWGEDPLELATIAGYRRKLPEVLVHLNSLARDLAPFVGPGGFALDESRTALFSLRTMSAGDTSRAFLRLLIEDVKDWSGRRQQRPAVLVIDEFAAFGIANIIDLLNQARSAELGIVLATQSVAGLGDENRRDQIFGVTRTKLLHQTEQPEPVASLAGTVDQPEASFNYREGEMTQEGVVRFQQTFRVHPNEAGKLRRGELFLIRGREAAKLKVRAIGELPPAPAERVPPPAAAAPEPATVVTPTQSAPPPVTGPVPEPRAEPPQPRRTPRVRRPNL